MATIKQKDLKGELQWNLSGSINDNTMLCKLGTFYNISLGVATGRDPIFYPQKKGTRYGISGNKIKGKGLQDLLENKANIGKIELYLEDKDERVELNNKEKKLIKKSYRVRHGFKYSYDKNSVDWLIYYQHDLNIPKNKDYKNIFAYVKGYKEVLQKKYDGKWHQLGIPRKEKYFTRAKITTSTYGIKSTKERKSLFNYSNDDWYNYGDTASIILNRKKEYYKKIKQNSTEKEFLKFTTAMLNTSPIMNYLIKNNITRSNPSFLRDQLKIPKINFNDNEQVKNYNKVLNVVDKQIAILENGKDLESAFNSDEFKELDRQVDKIATNYFYN